jgi:hypothetical protein
MSNTKLDSSPHNKWIVGNGVSNYIAALAFFSNQIASWFLEIAYVRWVLFRYIECAFEEKQF